MKPITATIAAAAAALAALAIPATASAATAGGPGVAVTAKTVLTNRPDGGGGGTWAVFSRLVRNLTITEVGPAPATDCAGASGCTEYTAAIADSGTWTAIRGALAPNQGPGHAGQVIRSAVTGNLTAGSGGSWGPFYSASRPSAQLVPVTVDGTADPSSSWPALAFAGPVYGLNESAFSYGYHPLPFEQLAQLWTDTSDGFGQRDADGQITG